MSLKSLLESSRGFPFKFSEGKTMVLDSSQSLSSMLERLGSRYNDDARLLYGDTTITDATPIAVSNGIDFQAANEIVSGLRLVGEAYGSELGSTFIFLRSIFTHNGDYGEEEVRTISFYVPGEDGLYLITFTTFYSVDLTSSLATIKNHCTCRYVITYTCVASGLFVKGDHNYRGHNPKSVVKQAGAGDSNTVTVTYNVYLDVRSVSKSGITFAIDAIKAWDYQGSLHTMHVVVTEQNSSVHAGIRMGRTNVIIGRDSGVFQSMATANQRVTTNLTFGDVTVSSYEQLKLWAEGVDDDKLLYRTPVNWPVSLIVNQTSMAGISHLLGEIFLI